MNIFYKIIDVNCVKWLVFCWYFNPLSKTVTKTDVVKKFGALFHSPDLCTKIRRKNRMDSVLNPFCNSCDKGCVFWCVITNLNIRFINCWLARFSLRLGWKYTLSSKKAGLWLVFLPLNLFFSIFLASHPVFFRSLFVFDFWPF